MDRTLSRPFLPKFALLFCTCRHAWTPGVERRLERRPVRFPGGRHEAGAVVYRLALRAALVHRRVSEMTVRCFLGERRESQLCVSSVSVSRVLVIGVTLVLVIILDQKSPVAVRWLPPHRGRRAVEASFVVSSYKTHFSAAKNSFLRCRIRPEEWTRSKKWYER